MYYILYYFFFFRESTLYSTCVILNCDDGKFKFKNVDTVFLLYVLRSKVKMEQVKINYCVATSSRERLRHISWPRPKTMSKTIDISNRKKSNPCSQ